jgi:hypothetical protein
MEAARREDMAAHVSLGVMALLGLALYSMTYSLLYGLMPTTPTPAVLEMWMVTTHLVVAGAGCVLRSALGDAVAEAQSGVFLGVALTVTLLASACGGGDATDCAAFFGAAALPRFAAVGAAAWAWIMYAGALGCQTRLEDAHSLTAACVLAMVPWLARGMLVDTCGDAWRVRLCDGVKATLIANGTASTIEADCSRLSVNLWVLGLGTAVGAMTACVPVALVRLLGAATTAVAVACVWAINAGQGAYFGTLLALTALACGGDLWALARSTKKTPAAVASTEESSRVVMPGLSPPPPPRNKSQ